VPNEVCAERMEVEVNFSRIGSGEISQWAWNSEILSDQRVSAHSDGSAVPQVATGQTRIDEYERAVLLGERPRALHYPRGAVRVVDICCGAGGLTYGATDAAPVLGYVPRYLAAVDTDREALNVYDRNFSPRRTFRSNINMLADFSVSADDPETPIVCESGPTLVDDALARTASDCDLFLAGPPCQGHSSANNLTRRDDPRNDLYTAAAATGCGVNARSIVMENVPSIERDHRRSLRSAIHLLETNGYFVRTAILDASRYGVSQTRKRHFLMANQYAPPMLDVACRVLSRPKRPISWAIGDLVGGTSLSKFDEAAMLSEENRARIDYLFDNDLHELPNCMRPRCHRNGHSYPSVYGRMQWHELAGTITQGFFTPGRGRYTHPQERRSLTAHEAARLQSFPDSFRFEDRNGHLPAKKVLTKLIGDAVPPWLARVPCFACILAMHQDGG